MADKPVLSTHVDGHQRLLEIVGVCIACLVLYNALTNSSFIRIGKQTDDQVATTTKTISVVDIVDPLASDHPSVRKSYDDVSGTTTIYRAETKDGEIQTVVPSGDYGFWKRLLGVDIFGGSKMNTSGDLFLGSQILNQKLSQVRREPGGNIIGLQKMGAKGKILQGPVSAYGATWWMVSYDETPSGWVTGDDITASTFWFYFLNFFPILWGYIRIIGWSLSIFFAGVILYVLVNEPKVPMYYIKDHHDEEEKEENPNVEKPGVTSSFGAPLNLPTEGPLDMDRNPRWGHVELLMKSHNQSDWRQAVIEADVMLEEMLEKMGYDGVTIGDKLKNVEENDFSTVDKAWEAHKVRNRIAHGGSDFKLSYDEAKRVVSLYEAVFREFYYI